MSTTVHQVILVILVLIGCVTQGQSEVDFSQPILPLDYQGAIKGGFATNYFKSRAGTAGKYRPQNINDIYNKGFRNVRLRSRADRYVAPYTDTVFDSFLTKLSEVVDKCLDVGVAPIVSWIHHDAEARATEQDRLNYITWWTKVAQRLMNKDYRLSFNLFTELGVDGCGDSCEESLRRHPTKYTNWTIEAIRAIRATGGNNARRILILTSPQKTSNGLSHIHQSIYSDDSYLMVEWHDYAAGPNKKTGSRRYWSGNGTTEQRQNLKDGLEEAEQFAATTGLHSYFGAWMPKDNKAGALNEVEVINFARFFVHALKLKNIPWSLNVLDDFYDTRGSLWKTNVQNLRGAQLNMSRVLENIQDVM